ncbi:hypothetical protein [Glaciibacter psychrotolerans]|uniref:Scaffolding protein n=1 Tax=Glaciibacter psychrotolerans TaxID=670054 RepID=A0A7Z0EDI6_9MICO|nr:hypothetical protein [Leifsonia psychrotolerans]NYJ19195.1 hypothetical protein [Leifsonia psychrotolerans]
MSETTTPKSHAARPLLWNRPRLRFIDGAPDGAAGTADEVTEDAAADADADETDAGESALGDPGKKALDAMKSQRNAERLKAKDAQAALDQLRAELALKDKPAEEQALETARAEARAEANKTANGRIVKVELRAAAKGKLADPADALAFLNLDDFDVNEDGEVDSAALDDAIDDLLARKPHLAAGGARKFEGSGDQGGKGKSARLSQVTQQELESMSPDQVVAARKDGRLNKLMGITS